MPKHVKNLFRRRVMWALWAVAGGLGAVICLVLVPRFLITGGCEDFVLTEVASPSGRVAATVFVRDCGATTAANTQVSLRQRSGLLGRRRKTSLLVYEGDKNLGISWEDENTLVVRLPPNAKVFRQEREWYGVRIEYSEGKR
jgi:hypothetical protein